MPHDKDDLGRLDVIAEGAQHITDEERQAFELLVDRTYSMHPPVLTLDELETLDSDELMTGYTDARRGVKAPGGNHSRAYVQGWLNGAVDAGVWPRTEMDRRNRILYQDCTKPGRLDRTIALEARTRQAQQREAARERVALAQKET